MSATVHVPVGVPVLVDPVGIEGIARRIAVPTDTVRQWHKRGKFPAPKVTVSRIPLWSWGEVEDVAYGLARARQRWVS